MIPPSAALPTAHREVLGAFAIGAVPRTANWVHGWLGHVQALDDRGRRFTGEAVRQAIAALAREGWLVEDPRRNGYWTVPLARLADAYGDALTRRPPTTLRHALALADDYGRAGVYLGQRWPSTEAALARLRLEALLGQTRTELEAHRHALPWSLEWDHAFDLAVLRLAEAGLWSRLHASLRIPALVAGLQQWHGAWMAPADAELPAQVLATLAGDEPPDAAETGALRLLHAQHLLLTGAADGIPAVLAPLLTATDPLWHTQARAWLCAVPAAAGQWAKTTEGMATALPALRKAVGKRRGVLPLMLGTWYVLALLAQGGPADLEAALKCCTQEAGGRAPSPEQPWGLMAQAIRMRLGERPREPSMLRPYSHGGHVSPLDWWRWLMRAWLKEGTSPEPLTTAELEAAQRLQARLAQAGLTALKAQLDAALQVLQGQAPPANYFIAAPQEAWRQRLAALQALADPPAEATPAAAPTAADTRLWWLIDVDDSGRVRSLRPREQTQGARGWGKPRDVTLVKLRRLAESLPAHDAAVARCIRQDGAGRPARIDLAAAAAALVGHPLLAFDAGDDAPPQPLALQEAGPELEVSRVGDQLLVCMRPGLHDGAGSLPPGWGTAAEQREAEALRATSVLRDSPQRARLVRLTPAQQRVAQLLGPQGLTIPPQGAAQLQAVLQGLGTQFQIHADDTPAAAPAREVPAEARLRAELTPVGTQLQVRLVAAPFGEAHAAQGPRLPPGQGRARVIAHLGNETLGVQRDLALERAHLDSLLDACPMLVEPADVHGSPCEWTLDDPQEALTLIERLRQHHAVLALDWPAGKAVRVDSAGLAQMTLHIRHHRDWLAVQGELQVDEHLVMSLKQLIGFAGTGTSRFVPLGEGRYLALTQELRTRLADLAAVTEAPRANTLDELRLPKVAAPWLVEASDGMRVEQDKATVDALYRLARARDLAPAVPSTLQATLRPYQLDGYTWARRLAEAGLGGCLADDMGLGKTLQALALLLARAAGGPALVVAPTSLMGNWQAEARRFAPGLQVYVYAESERDQVLSQLGDHGVLLVSYQMLQQDAAAFAAKPWHTLILDEAQAIKNAAAKRSQAVYALQADFKLALSGTPIENRLGELWSIMHAVNPGLLGTTARFNERFAGLIERQKDRQAQRTLRRLVQPFILRRTKAQVLDDLPPRTELVWPVTPEPRERAHYEALRQDALAAAEKSLNGDATGQAHLNVLAQLTRLRRAACDPRLVTPGLGWAGAKVQAFGELAAELVANGHKALVFSQFVDFLALLREPLDAAGIAYQYLDGSTPAAERTRRVNAFQAGEGELFLISLKAGGFGLNLTVADFVVIADPWWNPAAEDQAAGRAHRIGQQRPVTVYRLVNEGTLESRILALHADKRELANRVLESDEGAMSGVVPAPEELLRLMRGQGGPPD